MEKKRIVYFDLLNIAAALSVIFLHCNGNVHSFSNTLAWKQALIIEVVCYWAVPIFLMLSGANLMGYREKYSTRDFFKKRFVKTVIPFIIWSLLIAVEKGINPLVIGKREFINQFVNTKLEGVYWFFIPLFAVYLSMPVLSLLKDNRKILWYMAGGALLFQSVLPSLFQYTGLVWNQGLVMMTAGGLLIFPILGYLLSVTDFTRKQRFLIYALGIFGAILRYAGTYFLSMAHNKLDHMFFSYGSYYSVFLACAVFVFFRYFPLFQKFSGNATIVKGIKVVSGCSFGICLIHMPVYRFLAQFIPTECWQWRLLIPFAIYAIAFVITFLLKKIPVLRHMVP